MYHSYHYDVFNIKIRMNSVSTVYCTCVRPSRSCVLNLKCNSEKETVENEDNMLVVTNLSMKVSAGFCSNPPPPSSPFSCVVSLNSEQQYRARKWGGGVITFSEVFFNTFVNQ